MHVVSIANWSFSLNILHTSLLESSFYIITIVNDKIIMLMIKMLLTIDHSFTFLNF